MLLIVLIIMSFVVSYLTIKNMSFGGLDFLDWVITVVLGCVFSLGSTLLLLGAFYIFPSKLTHIETVEISALKDNSNVEGSFFLGTGSIEENSYYYFIKNTNKGKRMEKVLVDKSYINEGSDEAYVEIYKGKFSKFAQIMLFSEYGFDEEYIFYVPDNSVTTEFKVDME